MSVQDVGTEEELPKKRKRKTKERIILCYYQYLFSIKNNWTRKKIPVSFIDPRSKLLLEGYITTVKSLLSKETLESLEDVYVNVSYVTLPTFYVDTVEVLVTNIFPTKRSLTGSDELKCDQFNFSQDLITPVNQRLERLFSYFTKQSFSIKEIETYCNMSVTLEDLNKQQITTDQLKNCPIDGVIVEGYTKKPKLYTSISDLKTEYKDCIRCPLGQERKERGCNIVHGRGSLSPEIMIVGEAPGMQEEEHGVPFYPEAPAGRLLKATAVAAGIDPSKVWITNAALCRPMPRKESKAQNGTPTSIHLNACNTRFKNELTLLKPKKIILLGSSAYYSFFLKYPIGGVINNIGRVDPNNPYYEIWLLPHPSYVLRQLVMNKDPSEQQKIKEDYINLWRKINV